MLFRATQSGYVHTNWVAGNGYGPIDERIATYLKAIEVEGKTPKTIASYANSLQDFRRVGRRLGLPERLADYEVAHVYEFFAELWARGASPG